jgi:acetyltransferase-like isoleucine patch superfamily enzyme
MYHPTAIIESLHIGSDTKIWAFTHISKGVKIGKNCTIGEHVYIGEDVVIGDNCRIQNGAQIFKGVIIEDNVFIAPHVVTTNDIFPQLPCEDWSDRFRSTVIRKGASIGANVTIVCGNIIGKGAMVGAGSVVTKNIPDNELWIGNPAKFKKQI